MLFVYCNACFMPSMLIGVTPTAEGRRNIKDEIFPKMHFSSFQTQICAGVYPILILNHEKVLFLDIL